MKVLFCTSNLPASIMVRVATWSRWSHVALVDGDQAIEATWPRVCVTPLRDLLRSHKKFIIVDMPVQLEHELAILAAARSQVGKPYDVTAIFGFLTRRNWQDPDSWFCSELVAWAFEKGGAPLFRSDSLYRVTPQHLWMVAK